MLCCAGKVEPLSLEEMLAKKRKEEEEQSRPRFLTKQQREEEALRKRQEAVMLERQKQDQLHQARLQVIKVPLCSPLPLHAHWLTVLAVYCIVCICMNGWMDVGRGTGQHGRAES